MNLTKSIISYRAVYKTFEYFEDIGPTKLEQLDSFVNKNHLLYVTDLIVDKLDKRICNNDFSFLIIPLVTSIKHQCKLPKSLLPDGRC